MRFAPPHCPHSDCPSRDRPSIRYRRKGFFHRHCDGRLVQRFLCLHCQRTFSIQSFRLDYRLKRPSLHLQFFRLLVSKVTLRQSARMLQCTRKSLELRLQRLGNHCKHFHTSALAHARASGDGIQGIFQLDELETFEHARKLAPLSVPVLIERKSLFVLCAEAVQLPCRGRLSASEQARKLEREAAFGKRRSGSREAVLRSFEILRAVTREDRAVHMQTDKKQSYATSLRRVFGSRFVHERISSKDPRDPRNPLFPINHTLAMMRDALSRLVRRSWAASKKKERLSLHAWVWIAYRNYVRGITNKARHITPAMVLGVVKRRWRIEELLAFEPEVQLR